jgi:hypothetical protein
VQCPRSDRGFTGLLPVYSVPQCDRSFTGLLPVHIVPAVIEVSLVFFRCTVSPPCDRGFTGLLPVHSVCAVIEVSLVNNNALNAQNRNGDGRFFRVGDPDLDPYVFGPHGSRIRIRIR